MMRRGLVGLMLAGMVAAPLARASGTVAAIEPIATLHDGLLVVMRAGAATPFPQRFETLAPVVQRVFDLPGILRACVGPRWAALAPPDQARLTEAFRRFTVASYVANFSNYGGERFELAPDSRPAPGGELVETRIVTASDGTVRIDYLMRQEADAWRAVDVLLQGTISRVAVQRSDFRRLLGGGGDASNLIASLRRKVLELSGDTVSAG